MVLVNPRLGYVIAGHPHYEVTDGDILLDGESILDMEADERTKAGIFLAFQYPVAVPGVSVANFLRTAVSNVRGYTEDKDTNRSGVIGSNLMPMREFPREPAAKMKEYNVESSFARRYSTMASLVVKRNAPRFCRWPCLDPSLAFWTSLIRGWILMHCALSLMVSTSWQRRIAASC